MPAHDCCYCDQCLMCSWQHGNLPIAGALPTHITAHVACVPCLTLRSWVSQPGGAAGAADPAASVRLLVGMRPASVLAPSCCAYGGWTLWSAACDAPCSTCASQGASVLQRLSASKNSCSHNALTKVMWDSMIHRMNNQLNWSLEHQHSPDWT